jgi:hypothetical protein
MSVSVIHIIMDGPLMGGCTHTTGTGIDGIRTLTMDMDMGMGMDTLPMGTTADIRTWYTPAISAILCRLEEPARLEMQDIVVQGGTIALEDTWGRTQDQLEVREVR